GSTIVLPFDPNEIVDNLRRETYAKCYGTDRSVTASLIGRTYYMFRPYMPVRFRRQLQKLYLKGWHRIPFPTWPVDRTVETILNRMMHLSLESNPAAKIPFIWFWPDGYSGCMMMTHDVETAAGRDFCTKLADVDASFGIRASYQIVPEERYA